LLKVQLAIADVSYEAAMIGLVYHMHK